MSVYLLHIDPPVNGKSHYIGFTDRDPELRLKEHRSGRSKFTAAMIARGSQLNLVYVWPDGTTLFERWLKNARATKFWCPVCDLNHMPIPKLSDMPNTPEGRKLRVYPPR